MIFCRLVGRQIYWALLLPMVFLELVIASWFPDLLFMVVLALQSLVLL